MAGVTAFGRVMLYKAIKRPDGRIVCVDPAYLPLTSRIFDNERDFVLAKSTGWCDDPQEAMRRLEAEEDRLADDAVQSVKDDRRMSNAALAERQVYEDTTIAHVVEVPRRRGRPRKTPNP